MSMTVFLNFSNSQIVKRRLLKEWVNEQVSNNLFVNYCFNFVLDCQQNNIKKKVHYVVCS